MSFMVSEDDPSTLRVEDMDLESELSYRTQINKQLEAVADATLLVDHHCHSLYLPKEHPEPDPTFHLPPLCNVLVEPTPNSDVNPRHTLSFYRSLRDIHSLLASLTQVLDPGESGENNESDPHAIEKRVEESRRQLGPGPLARRCFTAAGIAAMLVDDGLATPPGAMPAPLSYFCQRLGVPLAKRILRLEREAEIVVNDLLNQHQAIQRSRQHQFPSSGKRPRNPLSAISLKEALMARIDPLPEHVVAFKSVVAYRSGLAIRFDWPDEDIEEALVRMASVHPRASGTLRLTDQCLIDTIVIVGLRVARRYRIPLQFHCGFRSPDFDLSKSNPLALRPVLERYPDVKVVILHAAWPFVREAAYLASVHPGVYLDCGLALPLLSTRGMARLLDTAMEVAPTSKLLYSSGAHTTADAFYLGAKWGRRAVAAAMAAAVAAGDMSAAEAKNAVRWILADNAIRLYNLPMPRDY